MKPLLILTALLLTACAPTKIEGFVFPRLFILNNKNERCVIEMCDKSDPEANVLCCNPYTPSSQDFAPPSHCGEDQCGSSSSSLQQEATLCEWKVCTVSMDDSGKPTNVVQRAKCGDRYPPGYLLTPLCSYLSVHKKELEEFYHDIGCNGGYMGDSCIPSYSCFQDSATLSPCSSDIYRLIAGSSSSSPSSLR